MSASDPSVAERPRIAIVVQRYGAEVNGGAELHARLLARALSAHYAVDILTSRALNYGDWAPHYPAGESWLDGCRVQRFDHPARARRGRAHMPLRHKLRFGLERWGAPGAGPLASQPNGDAQHDGEAYLRSQGPQVDALLDHLRIHGDSYAALIFLTALFFPTAFGVLVKPERSLLVPTLHDEKPMRLPHFHRVFRAPHRILFNTPSEAALAQRLYGPDIAPHDVCGVGIDLPPADTPAPDASRLAAWRQRRGLAPGQRFVLYLGRVDASKGCDLLFGWHAALPAERRPLLLVAGQLIMAAPADQAIRCIGFVDADERELLLHEAMAVVLPSRHESLSLVLLEAMAAGVPVIVHQGCAVFRDHLAASGAGRACHDGASYARAVHAVATQSDADRAAEADRGRDYVQRHYAWDTVVGKFRRAIDSISQARAPHPPAPA